MGERGYVEKYLYFSNRRVQSVATDNDLHLGGTAASATASFGVPGLATLEVARGGGKGSPSRDAITSLIERRIGNHAVSRFDSPPPAQFVRGVGRVSMSEFSDYGERRALFHVRVLREDGYRTDVVLFGSMDNFPEHIANDGLFSSGWSSSAARSIEAFLRRGINTWDDPGEGNEALAHEALKLALQQGTSPESEADPSRPHLRGFTIGYSEDAEWFAQVHLDVEMDLQRWSWQRPGPLDTERIVIGAPLWIRTPKPQAVVLYNEQRRAEGMPLERVRRGRHAKR